jgi:ABC-type polysaccharide/polyol phosphate export permease
MADVNEVQRLYTATLRLGRTRLLAIAGGIAALVIALIVWGNGTDGFLLSLFVGVAVVLFATTFALGTLACYLAVRHEDAQASQWSLKSLWFLLAGIAVVLLGWAVA